ncbi:hypothetical protein [Neobacillus soli]|uniref:hypothetical protein n=1 Tax=Neobacillus soli TaxID=220688 RepID=UPI00082445AA|nr:hypothetical protein [Neobacillus soli]
MSLTSKINGKTKRDKEFKEILLSIEPNKEDYYTLSKKNPFSDEYCILVPNMLPNPQFLSSLVGTAFDYLARFRIAQFLKREDVIQGWVATNGFEKLGFPNDHKNSELFYITWVDKILECINDSSMSITNLLEIAVHLAKLEQIVRNGVKKENINVDYLLFDPAPEEVINDLDTLLAVFEEKFMIPEIISKKSEVVFNPRFGVGSALVSGADADIFIDGTLYDFKTTKDHTLAKKDNLQLIGYFILNELAIATMSDDLGFDYVHIDIKRLAFYKSRYGEIEYYDVNRYFPYNNVKQKQKLKELAEHFKENKGRLHLMWRADIDYAKQLLEEIRNWDV